MSVDQFRAYRQTGTYGAYRVGFRKWPEMTIGGDGWTPGPAANKLAKWLEARLGSARPDHDPVLFRRRHSAGARHAGPSDRRTGPERLAGHEFAQADMRDVLRETKLAFGLSIQSIWERQLRAYLLGCARELRPDTPVTKKETANWESLRDLFRQLCGIGLDAFPTFQTLDRLQHLGNACRHGDGKSANELASRCPDLWRVIPPMPPEFNPPPPGPQPVAAMDIPVERLSEFVAAIAGFWRDAEYI